MIKKEADTSIRPSLISCINYNTGIIRIEKFQINFTLFSNTSDIHLSFYKTYQQSGLVCSPSHCLFRFSLAENWNSTSPMRNITESALTPILMLPVTWLKKDTSAVPRTDAPFPQMS